MRYAYMHIYDHESDTASDVKCTCEHDIDGDDIIKINSICIRDRYRTKYHRNGREFSIATRPFPVHAVGLAKNA